MKYDILIQAYSAMRHDLRKTLLTMLGMAWGIATVVLLLAYGEGFGRAIRNIWDSFGATAVGIYPGRTSQQAGGNKAGVQVRFTNEDIELLRNVVPLARHVSRIGEADGTVQNGSRAFSLHILGIDPPLGDIWALSVAEAPDPASRAPFGLQRTASSRIAPINTIVPRDARTLRINDAN